MCLYYRDFQPLSGDGHWQDVISPANKDPMCVAMDPAKDFLWRPMSCGGPEVSSFICEMPSKWAYNFIISDKNSIYNISKISEFHNIFGKLFIWTKIYRRNLAIPDLRNKILSHNHFGGQTNYVGCSEKNCSGCISSLSIPWETDANNKCGKLIHSSQCNEAR